MINNLERYTALQHALDQDRVSTFEEDLRLVEAIHQMETQALRDGKIYITDGKGGWKEDVLTQEEQAVFLALQEW